MIVQFSNANTVEDWDYGIRELGSSDPWRNNGSRKDFQGWLATGVDANRKFELYQQSTDIKTYLMGYTMGGVTFFTNRIDKNAPAGWSIVDISGDTGGDTAIGAVFTVCNEAGGARGYTVQMNGSTDNRTTDIRSSTCQVAIIGVDGSEQAQVYLEDTSLKLYLQGYITSGAVFFTNAKNYSTGTTSSYQLVDITGDLGSDDANGAFIEICNSTNDWYDVAVKMNGQGHDYYRDVGHNFTFVGIDTDDIFLQKIQNTFMDLYLTGYSLAQ